MQTDGTEVWYAGMWGENAGGGDANQILTLEVWDEVLSDRRVAVDLRLSIRNSNAGPSVVRTPLDRLGICSLQISLAAGLHAAMPAASR